MTCETPRAASARRYKAPSRSSSSPALQRTAYIYGPKGNARETKHRLGRPPPDPYGGVLDSSEPDFAGREELARQECSHLRQDVARRRAQKQQLAQRLESLEDSLQLRTEQLEELVDQLPGGAGKSKHVDLKEQFAQLHAWANDQKDMRGSEQLGRLREKLAETPSDSEKRNNQARRDTSSASSDANAADIHDRYRPRSASAGQNKSHAQGRHEDSALEEYAQTQKELQIKLEGISQQLEDQRRERQAQELAPHRSNTLSDAQEQIRPEPETCSGAGRLPPASEHAGVSGSMSEAPGPKEPASPSPVATTICQSGPPTGAQALRQELEALREGERAQRAAVRRRCRAAAAGAAAEVAALASEDAHQAVQEGAALDKSASVADLQKEFQQLQDHCRMVEQRAIEAEAAASEAQQAERAAVETAKAAEQHAWAATEAANELALQADLRQVEALEKQLRLQRLLGEAEARCKLLESVANHMACQQ